MILMALTTNLGANLIATLASLNMYDFTHSEILNESLGGMRKGRCRVNRRCYLRKWSQRCSIDRKHKERIGVVEMTDQTQTDDCLFLLSDGNLK